MGKAILIIGDWPVSCLSCPAFHHIGQEFICVKADPRHNHPYLDMKGECSLVEVDSYTTSKGEVVIFDDKRMEKFWRDCLKWLPEATTIPEDIRDELLEGAKKQLERFENWT